jgi:hypothetical protein
MINSCLLFFCYPDLKFGFDRTKDVQDIVSYESLVKRNSTADNVTQQLNACEQAIVLRLFQRLSNPDIMHIAKHSLHNQSSHSVTLHLNTVGIIGSTFGSQYITSSAMGIGLGSCYHFWGELFLLRNIQKRQLKIFVDGMSNGSSSLVFNLSRCHPNMQLSGNMHHIHLFQSGYHSSLISPLSIVTHILFS